MTLLPRGVRSRPTDRGLKKELISHAGQGYCVNVKITSNDNADEQFQSSTRIIEVSHDFPGSPLPEIISCILDGPMLSTNLMHVVSEAE